MPSKVIYDLAIKHSEYINSNNENKVKWVNVGKAMRTDDKEKPPFIVLDRHINLGGFANPECRDSILVSCFKPKDYTPNTPISEDTTAAAYAQAKGKSVPATPQQRTPSEKLAAINSQASMDFDDDDMPF